ncbi:cysteine and glycine-rich 1-like [Paramuricea clavata]|uniref:Cysteine and glycine-rich 1-like n=1 Tax=Paramuricea clavata TaxID=317549 RepID=A0A7D9DAN7_PARCT|nr:cysteine and glycine-rich 1-like [Paramuricea clavata]
MSEICPCCDKAVFSAEKAAISGKNGEVWHKQCLKCSHCKKRLDSMTFNEHKGQLYCKAHYGKQIGHCGYGYGLGAGTFHYTE